MKIKTKTSPIRYMGNKKKLINLGLISFFPKEISTFYDMFGGSGIVGLNTPAKDYVLNEKDNYVYGLYEYFSKTEPQSIIDYTKETIKNNGLPTMSTDTRRVDVEIRNKYKERYLAFREKYNKTKNTEDLYVLMSYSVCQAMRFNKKGEFNMPFGNNYFIEKKHGKQIVEFHDYLKKVKISNKDYKEVKIKEDKDVFVYLDPPYLNSTATYNENGAWKAEDQRDLLTYCDSLNKKGIRFGLSSSFKNKDFVNQELIDWSKKRDYKVKLFDEFDYCTFGTGRSNTVEVFIYNY